MLETFDIAVIGGGISGFSTALRLQSKGFKTIVLESHGQLGGCAGFFTKQGFSFDVGATTLVDFINGGVGGNFFEEISVPLPKGEYLDYLAWLPDRQIVLYRDREKWNRERLLKIGSTNNHKDFWTLMDRVTDVFWQASRRNLKLPIQSVSDLWNLIRAIGVKNLFLSRFLNVSMSDVLKKFKLENDAALTGLLAMLVEDTVHSSLDNAPFINAALGTTIRGAGLMRPEGGMKRFWQYLSEKYLEKGGTIKTGHKVTGFEKKSGVWKIETSKAGFLSRKIISSLPLDLTRQIAPEHIKVKLEKYIQLNESYRGSAIVLFLGVREEAVERQTLTHHQILNSYEEPFGNGNNMFISVSSKGDNLSAPEGCRAVMISTHCGISEWQNLTKDSYDQKKKDISNRLLTFAQKVYPNLDKELIVFETGTPRTYQKYTQRMDGSVGGYKQTLLNSNLKATPHHIGERDFWLVGDNTWPGLGTVAGLMGSKIVSEYARATFG